MLSLHPTGFNSKEKKFSFLISARNLHLLDQFDSLTHSWLVIVARNMELLGNPHTYRVNGIREWTEYRGGVITQSKTGMLFPKIKKEWGTVHRQKHYISSIPSWTSPFTLDPKNFLFPVILYPQNGSYLSPLRYHYYWQFKSSLCFTWNCNIL